MARNLPPLRALRVFEAAARHCSLTLAAEELHITHSAVSQQIRSLEDYFGQPLFTREARGVTLLPQARAFYDEIQACLLRIESAAAELRPAHRPSLRVCATPSLAMKWLIPKLPAFQQAHSDVDIELSTLDQRSMDRSLNTADIVIRDTPAQWPGHTCLKFQEDFCVVVAAPRFLQRHRIRSPMDCIAHPLLKVSGQTGDWQQWLTLAGVDAPSALPGATFDHQLLCIQAASNEFGLALSPWSLLEEDMQTGRLCPVFAEPLLPNTGLYAIYKTDSAIIEPIQRFVEWMATQGNAGQPSDFLLTLSRSGHRS